MRLLKTLSEGRENYGVFFSWSLLLLLPHFATAQVTTIPMNGTNTNISFTHPDPGIPSIAAVEIAFRVPEKMNCLISKVKVVLQLTDPLEENAELNLLAMPGGMGYESSFTGQSVTVSSDRTWIQIEATCEPFKWNGNGFLTLMIDNQNVSLNPVDVTACRMGIVEVILIEPGKWNLPRNNSKFRVYPNPANHLVNVELPKGAQRVRLLNLNGQVLKEIKSSGVSEVRIDVSSYPEGLYYIQVISQNEVLETKQFLVRH